MCYLLCSEHALSRAVNIAQYIKNPALFLILIAEYRGRAGNFDYSLIDIANRGDIIF